MNHIVSYLLQIRMSQRDDFLHKLSRYYVDSYDLIAVEDLNVSGMSRGKLA